MEGVIGVEEPAGKSLHNVVIEDNRISVTIPFDKLKGGIAAAVYLLFLVVLLEDTLFSLANMILFLFGTAFFVWYFARRKIVTVFDAFDKKVYRNNMLYCMREVDFSDIAEIVPVRVTSTTSNLVHYKIALYEDRLGKGLDLTDGYEDTHADLEYFAETALPAIEEMMARAAGTSGGVENKTTLDNVRLFTKIGSRYIRQRWGLTLTVIVVGVAIAAFGVSRGDSFFSIGGAVCILLSLLVVHSITIDTERKEVAFGRAFGKWEKVLPLERYSGMETIRSHTNGIYTGTSAQMTFENPAASYVLGFSYFTRKLSQLVEETKAIIGSVMEQEVEKEDGDSREPED